MSDDLTYKSLFSRPECSGTTLKEYINDSHLGNSFKLTKSGNLTFHWADWDETCKLQKRQVEKNSAAKKRLESLSKELEKLKDVPVFLQNVLQQNQVTLYDLYEGFLDTRLRELWFKGRGESDFLVSTFSCAGPYTSLSYMKWFDKEIYASFVYRKILTQNMSYRGFRLGMNLPITCCYDNYPLHTADLTLHQISDSGVLLKIEGEKNLTRLDNSEKIEFCLNTEPLRKSMNKSYDETMKIIGDYSDSAKYPSTIELDCSFINKFGNRKNIKSSNANTFFAFIPYEEFGNRGYGQVKYKDMFCSLINKVRERIAAQVKNIA